MALRGWGNALDSACLRMLYCPPWACALCAPPREGGTAHDAEDPQGTRSSAACAKRNWSNGLPQDTGCTITQAEQAVEAILAVIKADLQQGGPVILRRFGTFQVRAKRARVGRNPKTGDAAAIAARRVVRFAASATLKQRVDGAVTSLA